MFCVKVESGKKSSFFSSAFFYFPRADSDERVRATRNIVQKEGGRFRVENVKSFIKDS